MPILNPEHLFEQADRLIVRPPAGPPRQVDLRRAVSAAYYGLFHFTLAALADEFVGKTLRTTALYRLVYRSVEHRTLRDMCEVVQKLTPPKNFTAYFPAAGFAADIQAFATATIDLQKKRHDADYNPEFRFRTEDARLAIDNARSATGRFDQASTERRKTFLTLLLCPPR